MTLRQASCADSKVTLWRSSSVSSEPLCRVQMHGAKAKLAKRLQPNASPLDYSTTLRVVRDALRSIRPHPVVVSEGANTMDQAR